MTPNIVIILLSSLIPCILGFIWFHPRLFGGETWNRLACIGPEQLAKPDGAQQIILSMVLNVFIAFGVYMVTVHQTHVLALTGADMDAMSSGTGLAFITEYGSNFRTLGHGLLHGAGMCTLLFAVPLLGYVTIFEKKSLKYMIVYTAYWALCLGAMGADISRWGVNDL